MSDRTGLGPLETATLRAVHALGGSAREYVPSAGVLGLLERDGLGPTYLYRVLQDIAVSWRLHLPLLEFQGNFGSPGNDPAADAVYTEVRLSSIGRLALQTEAGETGPIPLGLIEGSVYRGGRVPPFDPRHVVNALQQLITRGVNADTDDTDDKLDTLVGPPTLPTSGTVEGNIRGLLAGQEVEMRMSCRISPVTFEGRQVLQITGFPLGANTDLIVQGIADRIRYPDERRGGGHHLALALQDHSSGRVGLRIVVLLRRDTDPVEAETWLRTIWPVSIDTTWQLPTPMSRRLRTAAAAITAQPDGFQQLQSLLEIPIDEQAE